MMELVIKIHEKDYQSIKNGYIPFSVLDAVAKGTPLPEHHGRLIDADELEECIELMNTINGETKYAVRWDDIRNMATITEADKENEQ